MNEKNVLDELLAARIPDAYANACVVMREVLHQLYARLEFVTLKPGRIVDMGCATGDSTAMLRKLYPHADITAVDSSPVMLAYASQQLSGVNWLCATGALLPLRDHSVDLIAANLFLPWCHDLEKTLGEWRRILRPEGLLVLTALGPDTLREFHEFPLAFPQLIDMHNIGDMLMQAKFADPVLDVDYLTLSYRDDKKLWQELQITGMIAGDVEKIQLEKSEDARTLSFEIIFGHAWGPNINVNHVMDRYGEVRIPVPHITRKNNPKFGS